VDKSKTVLNPQSPVPSKRNAPLKGYWLLLLRPPLGVEPLFFVYPETFSDAVDVVEVGAHLDGVGDRPVRPTRGAQRGDIGLRTLGRLQGQLFGVL